MEDIEMHIETLSLGPLGTNGYIVSKENNCLIIDPGRDDHTIKEYVRINNFTPLAILLTHAHFDHIGAVQEIRTYYNIDVYLHDAEKTWLENPELNRSILF